MILVGTTATSGTVAAGVWGPIARTYTSDLHNAVHIRPTERGSLDATRDHSAASQRVCTDTKAAALLDSGGAFPQPKLEELMDSGQCQQSGASEASAGQTTWGACNQRSEPRPNTGQQPAEPPDEAFPTKQGNQNQKRKRSAGDEATMQSRYVSDLFAVQSSSFWAFIPNRGQEDLTCGKHLH